MAIAARVQSRGARRPLRRGEPVRRRRLLGSRARSASRCSPLGSTNASTPPAFPVVGDDRSARGRAGGRSCSRDRAGLPARCADTGDRAGRHSRCGKELDRQDLAPSDDEADEARHAGEGEEGRAHQCRAQAHSSSPPGSQAHIHPCDCGAGGTNGFPAQPVGPEHDSNVHPNSLDGDGELEHRWRTNTVDGSQHRIWHARAPAAADSLAVATRLSAS